MLPTVIAREAPSRQGLTPGQPPGVRGRRHRSITTQEATMVWFVPRFRVSVVFKRVRRTSLTLILRVQLG